MIYIVDMCYIHRCCKLKLMVQAQEGAKDELEDIDITGISDVKEEEIVPRGGGPSCCECPGPRFCDRNERRKVGEVYGLRSRDMKRAMGVFHGM